MSVLSGPPHSRFKTPLPDKTLRRLFLTLFLRGHSSRGITKSTAPSSIFMKLGLVLGLYYLFGLFAFAFMGQSVLLISISLHSITFFMLGMFIAASSGEALFNKEESEILMHRPVTPQMVLRAKVAVLVQISLCMAVALNLNGLFVGFFSGGHNWLFPFIHAVSTVEEALFSTGSVILIYQLCLKWFGRERLDSVMTSMQVLVMISITLGSQLLPRMMRMTGGLAHVDLNAWWLKFYPPTWFACLNDAISGSGKSSSWILAGAGLVATGLVLWLSLDRLAGAYDTGRQALSESSRAKRRQHAQFRFVKALGEAAPVRWFLPNPVSQISFRLVSAYMARDRETKLRLYPSIAPMLVMPLILVFTPTGLHHSARTEAFTGWFSNFAVAISSVYVCILPMSALTMLTYSQQWRAAEMFVAAPIKGPEQLRQGARVAVVTFLGAPLIIILCILFSFTTGFASLALILAGVIAMPVYAMVPSLMPNSVPLANPIEEAQSTRNFPITMISMVGSFAIAAAATAAAAMGFLIPFLLVEALLSAGLCLFIHRVSTAAGWRAYD